MNSDYNTGMTKDFVYCGVETNEKTPNFIKMEEPKIWKYDIGSTNEWKRTREMKVNPIQYPTHQDMKKSQVQANNKCSTTKTNKASQLAAIYFSEANTKGTTTRSCS